MTQTVLNALYHDLYAPGRPGVYLCEKELRAITDKFPLSGSGRPASYKTYAPLSLGLPSTTRAGSLSLHEVSVLPGDINISEVRVP